MRMMTHMRARQCFYAFLTITALCHLTKSKNVLRSNPAEYIPGVIFLLKRRAVFQAAEKEAAKKSAERIKYTRRRICIPRRIGGQQAIACCLSHERCVLCPVPFFNPLFYTPLYAANPPSTGTTTPVTKLDAL